MTTDQNEIARLEGEVRGLKFRLAELQADQAYANKCACDEELAAVAIHIEAVASAWETLGDRALGRSFRMLRASLLAGCHRGAGGDRLKQLLRIMKAGGLKTERG